MLFSPTLCATLTSPPTLDNIINAIDNQGKNPAVPTYIFTEVGVGYRMLENELINQ